MPCSFVDNFLTKTVPQFFSNLAVPKSLDELAQLKPEEIGQWVALTATFVLLVVGFCALLCPKCKSSGGRVNSKIDMKNPKVVHTIPVPEAMAKASDGKLVFCRCWKSKNFPYCDGSHVAHNKETGDNVGPLIVKKQQAEAPAAPQ